ncbi:hypothetical protein N7507_008677 [Penicillium longicatenatum]|nr:hypothetical protein N7507_008677 [Penicillium longicatenatum]
MSPAQSGVKRCFAAAMIGVCGETGARDPASYANSIDKAALLFAPIYSLAFPPSLDRQTRRT